MNREQARHAESMARHMLVHVDSFRRRLQVIQAASMEGDYVSFPLTTVQEVFTSDLEYLKRQLDQVNWDMLAELEAK